MSREAPSNTCRFKTTTNVPPYLRLILGTETQTTLERDKSKSLQKKKHREEYKPCVLIQRGYHPASGAVLTDTPWLYSGLIHLPAWQDLATCFTSLALRKISPHTHTHTHTHSKNFFFFPLDVSLRKTLLSGAEPGLAYPMILAWLSQHRGGRPLRN